MEKKLQELSDIELKALAYDHLAQIQALQNNLVAINSELGRRVQAQQVQLQQPPQFIPRPPVGEVTTV